MRGGEREKRQGEGERRIAGDGTNQDRSWRERGGERWRGRGLHARVIVGLIVTVSNQKVIESLSKNEAYYILEKRSSLPRRPIRNNVIVKVQGFPIKDARFSK